jgi:hexokinase
VRKFEISLKSLKKVERLLTVEFTKGLESEGDDVMLKMLVTHIHEMPKGTEEGEFLVVDWGVNHLRVVRISELTYIFRIYDMTLHEKAMHALTS